MTDTHVAAEEQVGKNRFSSLSGYAQKINGHFR